MILMICKNCGSDRTINDELQYYYTIGKLIVDGELIKCPNCIDHEISFLAEPWEKVIPTPSFGLEAAFSPLNSKIIIRIVPARGGDESTRT